MSPYYYISRSKIEHLLKRRPLPWWKRKLKDIRLELSVQYVKGSLSIDPTKKESLVEAIDRIEAELKKEGLVGTAENPKDYVSLTNEFYVQQFSSVRPPVVFLTAATDEAYIGFGGSRRHILREQDLRVAPDLNVPTATLEPDVLRVIYEANAEQEGLALIRDAADHSESKRWAFYLAVMHRDYALRGDDTMRLKVLAQVEQPPTYVPTDTTLGIEGRQAIIGSPVYIAFSSR